MYFCLSRYLPVFWLYENGRQSQSHRKRLSGLKLYISVILFSVQELEVCPVRGGVEPTLFFLKLRYSHQTQGFQHYRFAMLYLNSQATGFERTTVPR